MSVLEIQRISTLSIAHRLRAHIDLARLDRSFNNLFVVPGIIIPLAVMPGRLDRQILIHLGLAAVAVTLLACSNNVLAELLDAPIDRLHPTKRNRPAALGLVVPWVAYAQWIGMMAAGFGIGLLVSPLFAVTALAVWKLGCFYTVPPVRTKDRPYLDVLSESANYPLSMLLGWFAVTNVLVPPVTLLLAYWMLGSYFLAMKRFGELSAIRSGVTTGNYRASFRHCSPESLIASGFFYASAAMLFLGAFVIGYRIELLLAFPMVALTMGIYCKAAFKASLSEGNPIKLYRQPLLMASLSATVLVVAILMSVHIPQLKELILPALSQSAPEATMSAVAGN